MFEEEPPLGKSCLRSLAGIISALASFYERLVRVFEDYNESCVYPIRKPGLGGCGSGYLDIW